MADERKDTVFQIRLSSELLKKFKKKCEESSTKIVPAEFVRATIEKFVKGDESNG